MILGGSIRIIGRRGGGGAGQARQGGGGHVYREQGRGYHGAGEMPV